MYKINTLKMKIYQILLLCLETYVQQEPFYSQLHMWTRVRRHPVLRNG